MEILSQVTNTQFVVTAAAVVVVLVCAALVFVFGFHSAEQPQFDKLSLVLDDKKSSSKKNKKKDKKSSPNRTVEDVKAKSDNSKKSPVKEKTEEKVKEAEKPKPKERPAESKVVKKEVGDAKKGKKSKAAVEAQKPADFDDGLWQEVPKKSEKKKVKPAEEKEKKKESPARKNKKIKDADVEAARPTIEAVLPKEEPVEETIRVISAVGPEVDEESARALQAQIEEVQRILKEAERREQAALGGTQRDESPEVEELTDVKDLRSNKKMENKEKQTKKKETSGAAKNAPKPEPVEKDTAELDKQEQTTAVFDELGDSWTDTKAPKKGKKKVRKDQ